MDVDFFLKNETTYYFPVNNNIDPDIKVFFTYKGMPVNPQFIDEYPEIYPSKENIQKKCEELKNKTQTGKISFFTVTEHGFEDIQLNILSDFPA